VGAAAGAWLVAYLAHNISPGVLQMLFGIAVLILALRMLGSRSAIGKKQLPGAAFLAVISAGLGGLASLLGIGGGALFVPMLNYYLVGMWPGIVWSSALGLVRACVVAL